MKIHRSLTVTLAGALAVTLMATLAPSAGASPAVANRATTAIGHVGLAGAAPVTVDLASRKGTLTSHVRGTFAKNGTVRGTFTPVRSVVHSKRTYVYGVLHLVLRRGNGQLVGRVNHKAQLPVKTGARAQAAATCRILDLVLGPLDLNLLGLKVHLNRVVLHIVAVSGPGNLLGNLLCAVAHLLDNTGLLGRLRLANVLNRILTQLGLT